MTTLLLLALLACSSDKGTDDTGPAPSDGGSTDDGGSSTDGGGTDGGAETDGGGEADGGADGGGEEACTATVSTTVPVDGEEDVYWRDPLTVTIDSTPHDAGFSLIDEEGGDVALTVSWDVDELVATVQPDSELQPATAYLLTVDVCDSSSSVAFSTSEDGAALEIAPEELIGRTYHFDTPAADWVKPKGIGTLLGSLLEAPLLVGVTAASADELDLLGAMGEIGSSPVRQDLRQPSWDLPPGSFADSPYFSAEADRITFSFDAGTLIEIPIQDFEVEGTFTSDGEAIGGAKARGLADTRYMGPLLGLGDSPTAICDAFVGLGFVCEACDDGVESCAELEAHFPEAPVVDGLVLREIE